MSPNATVARAQTLSVKQDPYVEAAIAVGVRTPVIIFRHIVPNIMAPVIVFLPAFGYRLRLLVRSDGHPIERVPYTSVIRSGPVRGRCRIR